MYDTTFLVRNLKLYIYVMFIHLMKDPIKPKRSTGRWWIYGGLLLLAVGFVLLIVFTFLLSEGFPDLFGQCIGVVSIGQELVTEGVPPGVFGEGTAGSEEIAAIIRGLNDRDDIAAVVFVINSPGGSVVATHEVYDAIQDVSRPKVAYFREVAASGGYYIATPTDYIVSDPDALTGSIGVVATFTEMSGLLDDIGVDVTTVQSGAHKDIGSMFREMSDEERAIFQALIDEVFEEFQSVVIENRGDRLDREAFDEILDGRVLSGRQAYRIGMVDALGRKQDAINKAAELAGIPSENIQTCDIPILEAPSGLFNLQSIRSLFDTSQRVELRYG